MSTSFVKKINTAPQLYKTRKGVKSYANQQYCISSGNPSLDQFIGGGFPIGSIVVLLEDSYSHLYDHFLKNYLGEGIVNDHKILIIDPDQVREKENWLKYLPAVYSVKDKSQSQQNEQQQPSQTEENKEQLKIAWRYQQLIQQTENTQAGSDLGYRFDNSREMGKAFANSMSSQLNKEELTVHMKFDGHSGNFIDLWEQIAEQIQNHLETESDDRIFRLLLPSFDQFLNKDSDDKKALKKNEQDLIRFLRNLKTLVRCLNGVCLIQFDEDLATKFLLNNITFLADSVIKLTSFKDHAEMQIGEYDGTIRLLKQPKLHGLICSPLSDFDVYALRLKSKTGIIVEKIHLEPEEDRSQQDDNLQQKGTKQKKTMGSTAAVQCNPTKSHQLDF